jgi:hypothetical protein
MDDIYEITVVDDSINITVIEDITTVMTVVEQEIIVVTENYYLPGFSNNSSGNGQGVLNAWFGTTSEYNSLSYNDRLAISAGNPNFPFFVRADISVPYVVAGVTLDLNLLLNTPTVSLFIYVPGITTVTAITCGIPVSVCTPDVIRTINSMFVTCNIPVVIQAPSILVVNYVAGVTTVTAICTNIPVNTNIPEVAISRVTPVTCINTAISLQITTPNITVYVFSTVTVTAQVVNMSVNTLTPTITVANITIVAVTAVVATISTDLVSPTITTVALSTNTLDLFNRNAASTYTTPLGSSWTNLSGTALSIYANGVAYNRNGAGANEYAVWNVQTADTYQVIDVAVQWGTMSSEANNNYGIPMLLGRFSNSAITGYMAYARWYRTAGATVWTARIYKITAGALTLKVTVDDSRLANATILRFVLDGQDLRFYAYISGVWTFITSSTDTTYTGSYVGLGFVEVSSGTITLVDNFGANI